MQTLSGGSYCMHIYNELLFTDKSIVPFKSLTSHTVFWTVVALMFYEYALNTVRNIS